ncbi:hypothetical protein H1D32_01705 [Anaerobacillus sp. CMMVII]|uniref:hypothetical protein n=1 Tax=Anaerobacillus sp. CMMVII TaxID=2755588 RepID=UPI0021B77A68|nr:hypothetical protein [Anaerobacillus sp. CMMVII]MCT8136582.1 hypothetical protein [Anaerobacillus sp. CMMVII]
MVIQSNMPPKAIVEVWSNTEEVFKKYDVPINDKMMEVLVEADVLTRLLVELNAAVGSSTATCIEGG